MQKEWGPSELKQYERTSIEELTEEEREDYNWLKNRFSLSDRISAQASIKDFEESFALPLHQLEGQVISILREVEKDLDRRGKLMKEIHREIDRSANLNTKRNRFSMKLKTNFGQNLRKRFDASARKITRAEAELNKGAVNPFASNQDRLARAAEANLDLVRRLSIRLLVGQTIEPGLVAVFPDIAEEFRRLLLRYGREVATCQSRQYNLRLMMSKNDELEQDSYTVRREIRKWRKNAIAL